MKISTHLLFLCSYMTSWVCQDSKYGLLFSVLFLKMAYAAGTLKM